MGVFKGVLDFLFGRDPDIFDDKGNVQHKFTPEKWKSWQDRFGKNPQYDWHHHAARETKVVAAKKTDKGTNPNAH